MKKPIAPAKTETVVKEKPAYFKKAEIKCACGASFTIGASKPKLSVEICSQCHPFYTGKEKIIDTAGRVEKFKSRTARSTPASPTKNKAAKQAARKSKKSSK